MASLLSARKCYGPESTVVLARLVSPDAFGTVAQAMVYVGIVGLFVDQGFSSALIQRKHIEPDMPGIVASVNLAVGATLTAVTIAIAPLWASFMRSPPLMLVLVALAPSLLIRAASVTPRAMLIRNMEFHKIGITDIMADMSGGALGVLVALGGWGYWAVVVQIVCTDIIQLILLMLVFRAGWRPNLQVRLLRGIAAFSGRAFAAGLLINSVARNIDNLLIGRFQGRRRLRFTVWPTGCSCCLFKSLAQRLVPYCSRRLPGVRRIWQPCAPRGTAPPALSPRCGSPRWH